MHSGANWPPSEPSGFNARDRVNVESSDQQSAEVNVPAISVVALQSDPLTFESFTDIAQLTFEANHALALHQATVPVTWIPPGMQFRRKAPAAFAVELGGHAHAESFVGALVVVRLTPACGAAFLAGQRASRWLEQLVLVDPVHLLVRRVLAGLTRLDKLHADPEFDPPRAQAGQAPGPSGAEGRAVVAADNRRQSVPAEDAGEGLATKVHIGACEQARRENETAGHVTHCQRLHSGSIAGAVPAFEVH